MAEIKQFLGLRNTTSAERLKPGELVTAQDVDLDYTGRLLTRKGTEVIFADACHSVYNSQSITVVMKGTGMYRVNSDFTLDLIKTLSTDAPVSYETSLNVVYYSNGVDIGRLVGGVPLPWGVDTPIGQPGAIEIPGHLPAGRYMYALTFIRNDGHESGTGLAGQIDLHTNGGIQFQNIEASTNPEVSGKMLYLTSSSGEVMYRAAFLPNYTSTYNYVSDGLDLSIPLITQFDGPPPAGTMLKIYNGVMYVVTGDTVFHSRPYGFELYCKADRFLRFPGQVVMFNSVNDGIYVGTQDVPGEEHRYESGAVWFLTGDAPGKLKSQQLFDYGVIAGTAVDTDAAYFGFEPKLDVDDEEARPAVVWITRRGICLGLDNGVCKNLTEKKYSFPVAQRGAGLVRLHRGYVQYLASLQGTSPAINPYQEEI